METELKQPPTKVTYATMSAERMDDLHREMDPAIAAGQKERSARATRCSSTAGP